MAKRAVLAFSGGLDSSSILTWMVREQGWEVVTFTANLGQSGSDSLAIAAEKSKLIGAVHHVDIDLRRELLEEFFLPAMQAHAKLEGRYLLGTSLARYPTARAAMIVANKYDATILAHGATGKGNDQVRYETTWLVLNANPIFHIEGLEIFAPWKDDAFLARFGDGGRLVMRGYLEEMGIPVPTGGSDRPDPYSQDENMLHISSEGVALELPEESHVDKVIYTRLTDPRRAPDSPEYARIFFERGVPVRLVVENEQRQPLQEPVESGLVDLFTAADTLAGRHGVGLLDMVEHRYVGLKSRGVYEAPGHTLLEAAHADLEGLVQDGPVLDQKYEQAPRIARLIYNGGWFSQELSRTLATLAEDQQRVSGWSLVRLYKGSVLPVARGSRHSLYDPKLVSFDDMTATGFDPRKARGFIDVQALHMWASEKARHVQSEG